MGYLTRTKNCARIRHAGHRLTDPLRLSRMIEKFAIKSPASYRAIKSTLFLFWLDPKDHLRSPITSTATKVSAAAAKQKQ
jgi:hypothetical protein